MYSIYRDFFISYIKRDRRVPYRRTKRFLKTAAQNKNRSVFNDETYGQRGPYNSCSIYKICTYIFRDLLEQMDGHSTYKLV